MFTFIQLSTLLKYKTIQIKNHKKTNKKTTNKTKKLQTKQPKRSPLYLCNAFNLLCSYAFIYVLH